MRIPTSAVTLTALLFFSSAMLVSFTGCDKGGPKQAVASETPLAVRAVSATPTDEILWIETLGETEGARQAEIRAQVSGTLTAITYKEGDTVRDGQTLFVIDDAVYEAALNAAKASVEQAVASEQIALTDYKRYEALLKANATSRKLFDDAKSALKVARAQLKQARAKQDDAQVAFDRTRVKAPSNGVAGRCELNIGALISANSTRLTTLTQPDNLRVKFQISERDLAGNPVTTDNPIRLFDSSRREIAAKLDYVSRQIDTTTSTRTLRSVVAPGSGLVPGELVSVQLGLKKLAGVYRIPQKCVQQMSDGTYRVFTEQDGRVRSVPVTVGTWKDTDWIILSGLKTGDKILIDQIQRLRDGLPVSVNIVSRDGTP